MMWRALLSLYYPSFSSTVVYMLQSCEYRTVPYLKWLWKVRDFSGVQHRKKLDNTAYARMLLLFVRLGIVMEIVIGVLVIILGSIFGLPGAWAFGLAIIVPYPLVWSHLVVVPLELGRIYYIEPKQKKQVNASETIFANHPAIKIAVAGSYGKTTMKEVLKTVLSQGLDVVATEANHNVAIEHAKLAKRLKGNEDVLIIEYGEGAPGDVERFSSVTHPTHGVITGIAPAHLDRYKTVDAAALDIFSLGEYLKGKNVYVNSESESAKKYLQPSYNTYGLKGIGSWKVSDLNIDISGTSFTLSKGKEVLRLTSGLLGRHNVGTLVLGAVIAKELGLTNDQIVAGIKLTTPFEHRMQPYQLAGAWIIDDTYNGNIEGIRAGTSLLAELKAKRKIYVTPGLVDQGEETNKVHLKMGELIAGCQPDMVVLMKNLVTDFINQGLKAANFNGQLRIESDPLSFYHNLDQFVASGDLVLMQNDWPDNYL